MRANKSIILVVLILVSINAFGQNVLYYCGYPYNCDVMFDIIEEEALGCSADVNQIFSMPSTSDVANKDVYFFILPEGYFSSAVAAEIENNINDGAILFVLGEFVGGNTAYNNRIDDLLSQIGSTMSNQNTACLLDCIDEITIEPTGSCVTNGMSSFSGNELSNINPGAGTTLMSHCGEPSFVEEFIGDGAVYYMSDLDGIASCMSGGILLSNIICKCSNPCDVGVSVPADTIFYCEGDPPFLLNIDTVDNNPPATIVWTADNGGEAYLDDPNIEDPEVTLPPFFEGIITYHVQIQGDTGMCIDYDSIIVVASLNPIPIIEPVDPICANGPGLFLVAEPEGGEWGGVADEQGYIDPMLLGEGTHVVTYELTNENMCSGEDQIEITIYDTATVIIEPIVDSICITAGDIELMATPEGGVWSDPVIGTIFNPEDAGIGTIELTYTFTTENGCVSSESLEINIIPEFISEIIGPDILCITDDIVQYEGIASNGDWGGVANVLGEIDPNILGIGTHEITYASPPESCNIPAALFVEIFEPPTATLEDEIIICNGGDETSINFDNLIIDGEITGDWEDVNMSGAMGAFPILDFDSVSAGSYFFTYTLQSPDPCEDVQYGVIVVVEDCACPSLALEIPEDLCQISVDYNLDLIKITDEDGTFTIIDDPEGINPAEISGNVLQGTDVDAGIYVIQF